MSLPGRIIVLVLALAVGTSPAASLLCARTCHGASMGIATSHASGHASVRQHVSARALAAESCHEHARMRSSSRDDARTLTVSLSHDARPCDHEPLRVTPTSPRSSDTMRSAAVAAIHAIVFLAPDSLLDGGPVDRAPFDSPSPPRAVRPIVLRI